MDSQNTQATQNSAQIPTEVRTFLEGMLQDAGMVLEDSMKEEMLKELYARLDNFLASTIINKLPPDTVDEFIKMTEDQKPQAEIEEYLKNKIPDAQQTFANAFSEFRELYLGNIAVARNAPPAGIESVSGEQTSAAAPSDASEEVPLTQDLSQEIGTQASTDSESPQPAPPSTEPVS